MKTFIKERIAAYGYSIVKDHSLDATFALDRGHPLEHLLRWPSGRFLFSVPAARIRGWGGRRLKKEIHPLVAVVADYLNKRVERFSDSALASFASRNSFENAAQALGLPGDKAPGFAELQPFAALFPWDATEPDDSGTIYRATMVRELCPHTTENIDKLLADRALRGQAMVNRLVSLARSVQREGFRTDHRGFHPIEGQLLLADRGDWVMLIRQGEHRVAVLAALDSLSFPVVVDPLRIAVVREAECGYWPQVHAGRITVEAARDVFRRVLRGDADAPNVNVAGWP